MAFFNICKLGAMHFQNSESASHLDLIRIQLTVHDDDVDRSSELYIPGEVELIAE